MFTKNIKFALIVSAILIAGTTALVILNKNEYKVTNEVNIDNVANISIKPNSEIEDTDNDGMKNWEEKIRGTNPDNPDSDNDGTFDGKEIQLGRDPLKKGPNDKVIVKNISGATSTITKMTETDKFSQAFFSKYMELRQTGQASDSATRDAVVQEILFNMEANSAVPTNHYSKKDIIITDDSIENTIKYANEVASAYLYHQRLYLNNPMPTDVSEDTVATFAKSAQTISLLYKSLAESLVKIKAPRSISEYHLSFLNNIYQSYESLTKLSLVENDPILSLSGIKAFNEESAESEVIMRGIAKYVFDKGIVFKSNDVGYFWYQKI